MEAALRTCCKGIKIGKILVVRHHGQMSRAGTSVPSPRTSTHTTPNQASTAAAADGPFNSPRRNQQWQQHNAATAAYCGSSSSSQHGGGSRPLSASSLAAAAAAQQDGCSNGNSGGSIPRLSPRGSPMQPPGGYSSEGGAFAAALATYGHVNSSTWIQNSTQDVIYEKLPADIAERHCLLMDPVLSTGNSAYTAIEVGGEGLRGCYWYGLLGGRVAAESGVRMDRRSRQWVFTAARRAAAGLLCTPLTPPTGSESM